jgi:cytochrome c biogenesis protein CcdA
MPWIERMSTALAEVIAESAFLAPFAAFLGGALTALNPCVLAMVPLMVGLAAGVTGTSAGVVPGAKVWRRTFAFSLLFVAGFALELALVFTVAAAVASWLAAPWWRFVLAGIASLAGLHLLGVLPIPALGLGPRASRLAGAAGAIAFGFLFGIVSLPCVGPVLLLLIGLVPEIGAPRAGSLLFLYGLGHSLLIVVAGTSVGTAAALIESKRLQGGARRLKQVAGILILAAGIWLLLQ